MGHHVTPFSALPSRTLCPPASASTVRSNSRGSAPSLPASLPRPPGPVLPPVCSPSLALLCPSSLVAGSPASFLSVPLPLFSRLLLLTSAPRPARARCGVIREATLPPCSPPLLPLPGPALPLVCSFSLVLPCPPSQAPGSLALCLLVPVLPLPPRHTHRGAIREASLPLPLHLAAPWRPGPWACGTHVALHPPAAFVPLRPPCLPLPPLPFSLSTPRRTLRRTLCRQVARMSQARTWPSLHDTTQDTHLWGWTALWQRASAPRLVQCPRALRAARSVVKHLFAPAPHSLFHAAVARSLFRPAISVPLPSGQREHDAEQFARQRSLFAPSLCPGPLALSCPLSARPPSSSLAPLPRPLGPWPFVSLSPSSLYPPGIHFAEQYARHPSHSLFTLPPPGALVPWLVARTSHCTRLRPLSLYACPASPSLPCPFPSLHYAGYYAGHCVGKSHACRRHAPGRYRRRRRAGWHHAVATRRCHSPRMSRRRGQPLQMPRGARPWLAPAAPRPGFHCTPRSAWSPGGIHHKYLQGIEKK